MSDLVLNPKPSIAASVSTPRRPERQAMLGVVRFGIYSLPLMAFTLPERETPLSFGSIDALALGKVVALLVVTLFGGLLLLRNLLEVRQAREMRGGNVESSLPEVLRALAPCFVFLGWAILSVFWTARFSVSLGQSGGMTGLLVMASLIGVLACTYHCTEAVLKSLCWSFLGFSGLVLMVHLLAPTLSGLDRRMLITGNDGVVHPTAAAANAGLGVLVVLLCWLVQRYSWSGRLTLIAVAVHGSVLFMASSRAALGMTLVSVSVLLFLSGDNRRRAWLAMASGLFALAVLLTDPGLRLFSKPGNVGVSYVTRGQSFSQLKDLSGRDEMWTKVWEEYLKSPWKGHGYFLTSSTGEMEVWGMKANHTAHNIYLQVIAGTGAIGLLLFMIAMGSLLARFARLRTGDLECKRMFVMLLVVTLWYLGWSLFCASFMGPVRSESVLFYTFIGLGVGQCVRMNVAQRRGVTADA